MTISSLKERQWEGFCPTKGRAFLHSRPPLDTLMTAAAVAHFEDLRKKDIGVPIIRWFLYIYLVKGCHCKKTTIRDGT